MIQFSLTPHPSMTITAQTEMAVKAGCQWIEANPDECSREELDSIISMCREAGIILVFKHNHLLVEETRVHGIRLSGKDIDPIEFREKHGGHPIIGVEITPQTPLYPLKKADVDYVLLYDYPQPAVAEDLKQLYVNMEGQGIVFPIVIAGVIHQDDIKPLLEAGASGFCIDIRSLQGPEYQNSLTSLINYCDALAR